MNSLERFFESDKQAILDYMREFYPSSGQKYNDFVRIISFDSTLRGFYLTFLEYQH